MGFRMRREAWLVLSLAGLLAILPLGWASLALLLIAPGFSIASLLKEKFTLAEVTAMSLTLSLLAIPASALFTAPLPFHSAPYLLGLMVIAIGLYNYGKSRALEVKTSGIPVLALGGLILIVTLLINLKTFSYQDGGLYYTFTHGLDQTFHLSIAQRYIVMPQVPPQDPYFAGSYIAYDWFMHVMLGEICRISGLSLFDVFKVVVSVASALIFLDAYILAGTIFKEARAAFVASLLYVLTSGLSWLYILLNGYLSMNIDTFLSLVYQWPGITLLKYDPTSLYFFLPQPQTFGLLTAIFCFYLLITTVRSRSVLAALITGLALGCLVFYHLITAFPVLATILAMSLYLALKKENRPLLLTLCIPLALSGLAVLLQYLILPANAGSQLEIGHHQDVLVTLMVTLGPLLPFAVYGIYKCWDHDGTKLLAIFAGVNLVVLNVFILQMTNNTYRFLTYLTLPVALFAGKVIMDWSLSKNILKIGTALFIALAMVPSTLLVAGFYAGTHADSLASSMDVRAVEWIRDNTPASAVIYESPDHFPRVPVIAGRNIAYAGQTYVGQYHGVDMLSSMETIMAVSDPALLHDTLVQYGVNYVLDGGKEAYYPFAAALEDTQYFKKVYSQDGFGVYEVLGVPVKG